MGYYDLEWKNLPVHHNLTKTIPSLASLTHNILIFPIFYQRRKIESFDFAQKAHQGKKDTKSLESFLVNCLVITVSTLGMLNSWLIMMPYVLLYIDLNLIDILFSFRAGFENISNYPACLSVYAHQFGFPLVFVGLFSAYILKKHWSTVIENFNGVHNWGRKIDLNFPPEKDQISQVQQPLQGKRIKDFEFNSICKKSLKIF